MPYAGICELCGRGNIEITRHHLIPRTRHKNKKNKRVFDRQEVRTRLAWLCRPCHKFVHSVLSEKEMEYEYNTVEQLRGHTQIQRFIHWIEHRPPGLRVRTDAPAGG